MAHTNERGSVPGLPDWAQTGEMRIAFDYSGPSELAKQLFGYRWETWRYTIESLHRMATSYDRNKAEEMRAYGANAGCLVWNQGWTHSTAEYNYDILRKKIEEYHSLDMRIWVYISLTNAFWKEMFLNEPASEKWRQRDHKGEPVPYGGIRYSGEVTRYLMCVNNPEWREYQKVRIEAAVRAGVDGVFWDNNFQKCFCPICRKLFKQFTKERLGKAYDIPPPLKTEAPSESDLLRAREVVFDWIPLSHRLARAHLAKNVFRYLSVVDILQELWDFARGLKDDIVWSNNGHLCPGIYDASNMPLSEDCVAPYFREEVLRTNAGVLKWLYENGGRERPFIANGWPLEVFAFGGMSYQLRDPAVNAFVEENAELYRDAKSPARVAVVASEMNYINRRAGFFDNLVRNGVQFDVIPLEELAHFDLSLYDVLVLRSLVFLSEDACERLRTFVRGGGTLVSTNATSLYDETWKKRKDYGLADVFGASARTKSRKTRVEHSFGEGRSILYPGAAELAIEKDMRSKTADALADDVKGALRERVVEMKSPEGVAVNVMDSSSGRVVHLLNYADEPAANVRVRLSGGMRLARAVAFGEEAEAKEESGWVTLPRVSKYAALVFER